MSIEDYAEHFNPLIPPDEVRDSERYMLAQCPVVHSDRDGGFWIVNRYEDSLRVLQDWKTFTSGNLGVRVPHDPPGLNRPLMPPIDSNPPVHRHFREMMNPYLSRQRLEQHEPGFRRVIAGLIDQFAANGTCDLARDLAHRFPAQITFVELFSMADEAELTKIREWVRRLNYMKHKVAPEVSAKIQRDLDAWVYAFVATRRTEPRKDDIIDALLQGTVEGGRPLTDEEIVGAIEILISGGFSTSADATCNIVIRLIEEPGLEALLREQPELIPQAIEEIMRLDPPVNTRPRKCAFDTEIGGRVIPAGDRVLVNYGAANHDPEQFPDAETFDVFREASKPLTFSAGPHRCIGSNMARLSLRVVVEELLKQATDFRFVEGKREERVSFSPGAWRAVDSMPITFTPIPPTSR